MAASGGDERRLVSLGADFGTWQDYPTRPFLSPDWTRVALIVTAQSVAEPEDRERRRLAPPSSNRNRRRQLRVVARRPSNRVPRNGLRQQQHDLRREERRERPAKPRGPVQRRRGRPEATASRSSLPTESSTSCTPTEAGAGSCSTATARHLRAFLVTARRPDRVLSPVATGGSSSSAERIVPYTPTDYRATPPQWSSDGSLVAVEAPPRLSVVRIGNEGALVSSTDRRDPTWSPVADELAASFPGPCRRNGIYRMAVPSTSRRLTLDCHIRGTERGRRADRNAVQGHHHRPRRGRRATRRRRSRTGSSAGREATRSSAATRATASRAATAPTS